MNYSVFNHERREMLKKNHTDSGVTCANGKTGAWCFKFLLLLLLLFFLLLLDLLLLLLFLLHQQSPPSVRTG
jgi:hypothetical protein